MLHDISEVERVEKTRRDFIANVSHELRTPLTSIRGYAETLIESDGLLNDSAREFLQVIRRNAERMGRLTEDLLVLARVESGEEKLDLRPHLRAAIAGGSGFLHAGKRPRRAGGARGGKYSGLAGHGGQLRRTPGLRQPDQQCAALCPERKEDHCRRA